MASVDDLRARNGEINARLEEIDAAAAGQAFTDEQRDEWNALNNEVEANKKLIAELEARVARIAELSDSPEHVEKERVVARPQTKKRVPDDPTDLHAYRNLSSSVEELSRAYQEGAMRVVERIVPAVEGADEDASKARLERALRQGDTENKALARRIISTSSPTYERAWSKYIGGGSLTSDEQRAMSLTVGAGGYAVPTALDPTVILVSAGVVNPIRQLARVESIAGNTWYGVSSTGLTASYGAEATEASDNSPTLVQPSLNVEKAQAFIPFSIEIGQDWGSFASEMGRLFADAKDNLENSKFHAGLGHGSNEPQGLIAAGGATAAISSATTAVFAIADLYSLEAALSPRFRASAQFVGNKAAYQKIRQFDTSGGAGLWVQLPAAEPGVLLGYPAHEWSAYSSAVTTSGATLMTFGDFSKFLIVDKIGMDVELIPHLFATANNRPSGQRGLYCYWRNSSAVLSPGLQANSAFVSLKLL